MPDLLVLGLLLLAALAIHGLAPLLRLPRVTLLLLVGVAVGPVGLDLLPPHRGAWFEVATTLALTMIGFLLGGEFTGKALREHGARPIVLSLGLALGTAVTVALGLAAAGTPWPLAILLGGIAPATAPAATVAVLDELEAKGPFASIVRSIVALDDVWGLLAFSLALALASALSGTGTPGAELLHAGRELGTAALLGVTLGAFGAAVTGRLRTGQPLLLEALGLVLVCAGAAEWWHTSALLSSVVMGATVANLARHHEGAFRDIEDLEWPVLVVFFLLAGSALEVEALTAAGGTVAIYVLLRVVGRFVGLNAAALALPSRRPEDRTWLPIALLPQAGVALGLALEAADAFPGLADALVPTVVASTLVFEVAGPPLTRLAVLRVEGRPQPSAGEVAHHSRPDDRAS